MKIAIIVEGETEQAFMPYLRKFLETRLVGSMPKLKPISYDRRIPTNGKLKRTVDSLLTGKDACDHVIALTDVYTGTNPPDFINAADAKTKMRTWVGANQKFHPHAAQHDFEAWLLPYWSTIQKITGSNKNAPGGSPETVNHGKPPAYHIQEVFYASTPRKKYIKPRDAGRILRDNNLLQSINQCSELKDFVNTIINICGGQVIP